MAGATFDALGEQLLVLGAQFSNREAGQVEALSAMSAGAIKRAVAFHFNASLLSGVPIPEALRRLGDAMLDDWNDAVQAHVLALAKKPGETVQ